MDDYSKTLKNLFLKAGVNLEIQNTHDRLKKYHVIILTDVKTGMEVWLNDSDNNSGARIKHPRIYVSFDTDEDYDDKELLGKLILNYITEYHMFSIYESDSNGNDKIKFRIPEFKSIYELKIKLDMM